MKNTGKLHSHTVIFVAGPPGSGKGTLCKLAVDRAGTPIHRYVHLSVGDYLRKICPPPMEFEGELFDYSTVQEYLSKNKLLPAAILIPLLEREINLGPHDKNTTNTWLIDGFPRNMETALAFEKKVGMPVKVIILECSRGVAEGRFLKRGREEMDDEKRFAKRYNEYVENIKVIRERYANIVETVHVDGDREGYQDDFLAMLRQV